MRKAVFIFFLYGITCLLNAQDSDSLVNRFLEQLAVFPHEKIYVQTDKHAYLSGERVWLRSHLVEASTHMPAHLSRYVYIELFNPFDELIQRIKIRPDSLGVFSGHLDLDEELPEGSYEMRAYTRYMRNQGEEAFFKKSIQVLDPYSLQVEPKVDFTVNGNRVNASVTFEDASSGESITPEIVTFKLSDETARRVSPDESNHFEWSFSLTKKRTSRHLLLAIVHNGRKYNRYFPIPHDDNEFDVTFHPEGGYLVPYQACQVGFKAVDPSGLSIDISGTLYNSKDEEVVQFNSRRSGMGFLNFMPQQDEKYYAMCKTPLSEPKRFELPIADFRARTVSARITGDNRLMVSMLRGNAAPQDSVFILIHHKGLVYFHKHWADPTIPYSFYANNYPSGILSILLLNQQNAILSERMIFNMNEDDFATLEAQPSAPAYKRRELISIKLQLKDTDTIAFADNMAVAVTDKNSILRDSTINFLSSLLLTSELKGNIESPATYFNGARVADKHGLDALMLTQGWKRYDIPAIMKGDIQVPDQFLPEEFQEITGRAELLFGGLKEGEISLYATLDTLYSGETTTADDKGRFMFKVEYPEGTEITIQSLSKDGKKRNLIHIDPVTFPDNTTSIVPVRDLIAVHPEDLDAYLRQANEEYRQKYGMRTIMLEEVTITAKPIENIKESKFFSPIYSSGLMSAEDIEKRKFSSFRSLLTTMPGLVVRNDKVTTTRSNDPVVFLIDDLADENFFDQLDALDVSAIDNIFIMKDNTGLLGYYPNTSGAVVITTKSGFVQKNVKSMNIDRINPLGYQVAAEFYTPKYETQEQRDTSPPDLRTTIYWKPNVQFSKEGEAMLEFYGADTPTIYQVVGEGITSAGKLIRLEKEITIEGTY